MKKLLILFVTLISISISAQTVTDSVSTSIGDFILVTSEQVNVSNVYSEESITTSDGGNGEFVAVSSNARFMLTPATSANLQLAVIPNPTAGTAELTVTGITGTASVVVTNVLGQIVYSSNTTVDSSKQIFLPSQLWQSGAYLIVVSSRDNVQTERLIVR